MKNPSLSELRQQLERDSKRWPLWKHGLVWCVGIFALWLVLGFVVAPPILRAQLEKRLSEQLHRPVTVGKVSLNPLTFSVSLESVSVSEPGGGQFFGWRRLFADFDAFSLFRREWRFQQVALDGFAGKIAVAKDGRLNFADLLASPGGAPAAPQPAKKPWPLLVRRLTVTDARLSYRDASRAEPFATDIGPVGVSLFNFYTGGPKQAPGEFSARTESGETFAWRGALSLAPLSSSGDVTLGRIALKKYAPYYSDRVKFDLRDGGLDAALHYDFSIENGAPVLRISNGQATLHSLQIARRGAGEPVIVLNLIELTGLTATYPKISFEAARLAINGGSIMVQRGSDGINLVDLLTPLVPAAPPAVAMTVAAPAAATPPLNAKVTAISIRGLAVTIEDRTTPRPARHELTEVTGDLRNLSLANLAAPMPFGFKAKLAPDGVIHAAGTVSLAPMKAEFGLELDGLALANFSPYVEKFVNMRIGNGRLAAALNLRLELPPGATPVVAAQGDIDVAGFDAYDAASVDEIAGWRSLSVKGLDYSSDPSRLMIGDIEWVGLTGHLIVNADHALNLETALQLPGAVETPAVAMPDAAALQRDSTERLFIALDRLVLDGAAFDFVDRSLQPNVRVSLNELSGEIEGLASSDLARATVDLRGKVDGVAPFVVTGKINPLSAQAFTDLDVSVENAELAPVGPYVGKYAGYELARGSLNLDMKCHVAQGRLDAANVVTLDQFSLGDKTDSSDATTLPVRLAVALMRDPAGRIVLDVPVQGNLDDPNFQIGRVVLRVVTNLLTKAATAPFALVGSMFGGSQDQDLSHLQFAAGDSALQSETEAPKLDVMARALLGRPALHLEIVGGYDKAADGPVLREQALEREMRTIIWTDRRQMEPDLTLDQVQLDPMQKTGMVRRFYFKMFPGDAPRRVSVNKSNEPSPPVSGQRGNLGFFRRVRALIARTPPAPKAPNQTPSPEAGADASAADGTPPVPPVTKPLTVEEMKARLLERMPVDEETFRQLAAGRAKAVRDYLVNQGEVPAERLSLMAATAATPVAKGTRVDLLLK